MFNEVDLLLLIQSDSLFIVAPIVCGLLCLVQYLVSFLVLQSSRFGREFWLSGLLALSNMFKLRAEELTDQLYSCGYLKQDIVSTINKVRQKSRNVLQRLLMSSHYSHLC